MKKHTAQPTQVMPTHPDCYVCERGGISLRYIGKGLWRHEDCAPGSTNWCEWYDKHPESHSTAGKILRAKG